MSISKMHPNHSFHLKFFAVGLFVVAVSFSIVALSQRIQQEAPVARVQTDLPRPVSAARSFRFISFADTRLGRDILSAMSNQITGLALAPSFALYMGDVQDQGFDAPTIGPWIDAFNGDSGNGLYDKTFLVRGNHDNYVANSTQNWSEFFAMNEIAKTVDATHYAFMPGQANLTYSFDYAKAHFVGIDDPGDNTLISPSQLKWLDGDLASAKNRKLSRAFLFFHGPLYYVNSHMSEPNSGLVAVINKHPFVAAIFHGHEHVMAYVHLDNTRIPGLTHSVEEFVTGSAGAPLYTCTPGRSDYCGSYQGFASVDVSDNSYTVTYYEQGQSTPKNTWTFGVPSLQSDSAR